MAEHQSSDDVRTALISGETFHAQPVQYAVVDGLAMFEGDIILGTVDEVEQRTQELRDLATGKLEAGIVIPGARYRWPNCVIPYTIDPALPSQNRVTDAIAHWQTNTRIRLQQRTNEADYVTFRPGGGCSSWVGKQGNQQFINLAAGCGTGSVIHEIGHTVGLWHEQSREDRDTFVTIHWDKIQPGMESNFNQHITDGDDVGPYDYGSIMHYPRTAFSVDGSDTITPTDPNATIGQRNGLSAGDIAAANSLCPPKIRKETIKDRLKDLRADTRKELVKDVRLDTKKELVLDTKKEMLKDRVKEVALDPPWRKRAGTDLVPPGRRRLPGPIGPGGLGGLPFAVATPHQAPGAMGQEPSELEATIGDLDAQLEAVADALAAVEAQQAHLQAQYDELAATLEQTLGTHDEATDAGA